MQAPESRRCEVCGDDHLHLVSLGLRKAWFCPNCAARYTTLNRRLLSVPGTEIVRSEVIDAPPWPSDEEPLSPQM